MSARVILIALMGLQANFIVAALLDLIDWPWWQVISPALVIIAAPALVIIVLMIDEAIHHLINGKNS